MNDKHPTDFENLSGVFSAGASPRPTTKNSSVYFVAGPKAARRMKIRLRFAFGSASRLRNNFRVLCSLPKKIDLRSRGGFHIRPIAGASPRPTACIVTVRRCDHRSFALLNNCAALRSFAPMRFSCHSNVSRASEIDATIGSRFLWKR